MREDTYGGSTPEETFAMFLDALRAGNTDLASKYFVLSKQEEYAGYLKAVEDDGNLTKMINDFERAQVTWTKRVGSPINIWLEYSIYRTEHTVEFPNGLKKTFEAGEYGQSIGFLLNEKSHKWKISTL